MCTSEKLKCIFNVTMDLDTSMCARSCSGLMITSYFKSDFEENLEKYIPTEVKAYENYKKGFGMRLKGSTELGF